MGFKLNIRGASDFLNILKDLYVEIDNTNWSSDNLSGFLDEVATSLEQKKDRQVVKTALDYTSVPFDIVLVDTTANVTVTLPASPTQGDEVYITDVTGNSSVREITVARNGSNINGQANDLIMDIDLNSVKLIFDNATNGWHLDIGGSYLGKDASEVNNPFVTLNADFTTGTPTENGGIIISRGDAEDVVLRWNELTDKWQVTEDGTNFTDIITTASVGTVDHGELTGLGDDDHTQYMHVSEDRTVSATHTFNPDTQGAPFEIGPNANKQKVDGLNAEFMNSIKPSTLTTEPTGPSAGDFWIEEV